jgi:hypothetical protein
MRIFGIDFTSAPSSRKPISCAVCEMQGSLLCVQAILGLPTFTAFEDLLRMPGPWLAACDFPFAQPEKLLVNLGWPTHWEECISRIAAMGRPEFEAALSRYRSGRPAGDKHHLRATDRFAGARSPMMLQRVPVGKMFFQGAPRLLSAGVSILPCHPTNASRIAVEAYPALVARKWLDRCQHSLHKSYKSDERSKQSAANAEARRSIVDGICSPELRERYGLILELPPALRDALIDDPMGDSLDAVLCAVQAAWAYLQRDSGYGIPSDCDGDEGWIVDEYTILSFYEQQGAYNIHP